MNVWRQVQFLFSRDNPDNIRCGFFLSMLVAMLSGVSGALLYYKGPTYKELDSFMESPIYDITIMGSTGGLVVCPGHIGVAVSTVFVIFVIGGDILSFVTSIFDRFHSAADGTCFIQRVKYALNIGGGYYHLEGSAFLGVIIMYVLSPLVTSLGYLVGSLDASYCNYVRQVRPMVCECGYDCGTISRSPYSNLHCNYVGMMVQLMIIALSVNAFALFICIKGTYDRIRRGVKPVPEIDAVKAHLLTT
jgi:hypothetical protein